MSLMGNKKKLKPWHRRAILIASTMLFIASSVAITLYVFRDNMIFFFTPTELLAKQDYNGEVIRIGGVIQEGSVQYSSDLQNINFIITDFENSIRVEYHGQVPSLFKEGSGTVALGRLADNIFEAKELLAKHDENYMPKEVADALKEKGQWQKEYSPS